MRKKTLILLSLVTILLLISVLPACTGASGRKEYEQGVEYYNNGEYALAKECFNSAEGYGNSADFLKNIAEYEKLYLEGTEKINNHDYSGAYAIFEIIPKYENSQEYMDYIDGLAQKFVEGEELYNQKKFTEARLKFIEACSYSSSDEYIKNIDAMTELYNKGIELKNAGKYYDAIKAFSGIGAEFEDSVEQISDCMRLLQTSPFSLSDYMMNYNAEYPDGSMSLKAGSTGTEFSLVNTCGVLVNGIADENGMISLITFSLSDSLKDELGESGFNAVVTRLIHATNPYYIDVDELEETFSSFFESGAVYGCMHFELRHENGVTTIEGILSSIN